MPDAGLDGGVDRGLVLAGPLAELVAGDQQHPVRAGEGVLQRGGVVEVDPLHGHAALGQVGQLLDLPAAGDDLVGRDAAVQQVLDHEAAQVAGGSGDDDRHGSAPSLRDGGRSGAATG